MDRQTLDTRHCTTAIRELVLQMKLESCKLHYSQDLELRLHVRRRVALLATYSSPLKFCPASFQAQSLAARAIIRDVQSPSHLRSSSGPKHNLKNNQHKIKSPEKECFSIYEHVAMTLYSTCRYVTINDYKKKVAVHVM